MQFAQVGRTMTDEDRLEQALNGLPSKYENVISKLEAQIGDLIKALTIRKLHNEFALNILREHVRAVIDF